MPAIEYVVRAKWNRPRPWVAAIALAACAATAHAQNKCTATGVMAGEKFSITHCAAAVYPDSNSVTIWFNEGPITPQEDQAFQSSAYADSSKVDRIAGDVKPGGRLTGRITGSRSSDGRPYSWDLTFDVTLPPKEAASGLTCGK